jgi:HEAT repeat protein
MLIGGFFASTAVAVGVVIWFATRGQDRAPEGFEEVLEMLARADAGERREAVEEIARWAREDELKSRSDKVITELRAVFKKESNEAVRMAMSRALQTIALRSLAADNWEERRNACYALREVGTQAKDAIPKLIPLVNDTNAEVAGAAERALAEIGPPNDVGSIVGLLGHKAAKVRICAARTLGTASPTPTSVTGLLKALEKDEDNQVRHTAAIILPGIVSKYPEHRNRVIPALLTAVGEADPGVGKEARNGLGRLRINVDQDLEAIREALITADSPEASRKYAIDVLAKKEMVNKEIVVVLLDALKDLRKDAHYAIRLQAVEVLGKADGDAAIQVAVPALLEAIENQPENTIQDAALVSLKSRLRTPPKSQIGQFVKLLKHKRDTVQSYAVEKLGEMGPDAKQASPGLQELALNKESKIELRRQAISALGKIGPADDSTKTRLHDTLLQTAKSKDLAEVSLKSLREEKVGRLSPADIPKLVSLMNDTDMKDVRAYVIQTLANMGENANSAAKELQRFAKKGADIDTRKEAIAALGRIGRATGSVEVLIGALDNQRLTATALAALQETGIVNPDEDYSALAPLISPERKLDPNVRGFAVQTLGKAGGKAAEFAKEIQEVAEHKDTDPNLRQQAIVALGGIGRTDGSVETLTHVALHYPELNKRALESLEKMRPFVPKDTDALAKLLRSKEAMHRSFSAGEFAKLKGDAAVKALTEALAKEPDPAVCGDLVKALGEIGSTAKSAIPTIISVLERKVGKSNVTRFVDTLSELCKQRPELFRLAEWDPALRRWKGALRHENPSARLAAAQALGRIGKEAKYALPALDERAAKDSDDDVRNAAQEAKTKIMNSTK